MLVLRVLGLVSQESGFLQLKNTAYVNKEEASYMQLRNAWVFLSCLLMHSNMPYNVAE